jgi:hypothetical protein
VVVDTGQTCPPVPRDAAGILAITGTAGVGTSAWLPARIKARQVEHPRRPDRPPREDAVLKQCHIVAAPSGREAGPPAGVAMRAQRALAHTTSTSEKRLLADGNSALPTRSAGCGCTCRHHWCHARASVIAPLWHVPKHVAVEAPPLRAVARVSCVRATPLAWPPAGATGRGRGAWGALLFGHSTTALGALMNISNNCRIPSADRKCRLCPTHYLAGRA